MARYTIIDLGTLGGENSWVTGVNDLGQVVGFSDLGDLSLSRHGFRTAPNSPINHATDDLGSLGGGYSGANGINNAGQVVGDSITQDGKQRAFRTAPNSPINPATDDLGSLGNDFSTASGINESGQVVGTSSYLNDPNSRAYRTAPNSPINPVTDDIGRPYSSLVASSGARSLNNRGQVIGNFAPQALTFFHCYRTAPNSPINPLSDNLDFPGASSSNAVDINNTGQVIGWYFQSDGTYHAFRTGPNGPIDPSTDEITTPDGSKFEPAAINDAGDVVGNASNNIVTNPYLYQNGIMHNLKGLIPADSVLTPSIVYGINNAGQIVGNGLTVNGNSHAFLMTPDLNLSYKVSELVLTILTMIGGIPVGGGGIVVLPGGKPVPVPPRGPSWHELPPEIRDFLVGSVMRDMSFLLNNAEARKEMEKTTTKLLKKQGEQMLKSLIKGEI